MTKLIWDKENQRRYEFGIDRGVFYSQIDGNSYGDGVVWDGLVSLEESSDGGDRSAYYFDGIKYMDVVEPRDYQAEIEVYSTPEPFFAAMGRKSLVPGFILTRQPRNRFGLSYRTLIGPDEGYKVHIVYNILANPINRNYSTIDASGSAETFSYKIVATPPKTRGFRPSAHYILDSTKTDPDILQTIEEILYGTDDTAPQLPDSLDLIDLISTWDPVRIIPQSSTGLAQLVSGVGDLHHTDIEGINRDLPQTRLQMTPIPGLYRLE